MDYLDFFGFKDAPFRLTPDPDYFFPSRAHQEALQTLFYSIRSGEGFVQITGAPGTGKTLLLRTLLKELGSQVTTALVLNPCLEPEDLLKVILDDFGLDPAAAGEDATKHDLMRVFRDFLLEKAAAGTRAVIIVDEAQNLPVETLEELRLLSNLETEKEKLLQIFLVGQPELEEKLAAPALLQLSQRITIRYRLTPLNLEETETYIRHRLKIAAPSNPALFSRRIIDRIHRQSGGVPRLINILCERILMAAYIDGQCEISNKHLENARRSIGGELLERSASGARANAEKGRGGRYGLLLFSSLLLVLAVFVLFHFRRPLRQWLRPRPEAGRPGSFRPELSGEGSLPGKASAGLPAKAAGTESVASRGSIRPAGVLDLPAGSEVLVADRVSRRIEIWRGRADGSVELTAELPLPDMAELPVARQPSGLSIVVCDTAGMLFFNPYNFLIGHTCNRIGIFPPAVSRSLPRNRPLPFLWRTVGGAEVSGVAVAAQTRMGAEIKAELKAWSQAWRRGDLEAFMSHYAPIVTIYNKPELGRPAVLFTREKLREIKARLFARDRNPRLRIEEPRLLSDPASPDRALALFYQSYRGSRYRDEGWKALYLHSDPEPGKGPRWLITAKVFFPMAVSRSRKRGAPARKRAAAENVVGGNRAPKRGESKMAALKKNLPAAAGGSPEGEPEAEAPAGGH